MKFIIEKVDNKSNDWKITSIKGEQGNVIAEVSVNRVNKKGETFPNFDGIILGATIDGELWTSATGKNYLFAPKPASTGGSKGNPGIAKAMEKKNESIAKFQDSKETSIKLAGAMRDAVLIVTTFYKDLQMEDGDIELKIKQWRNWFLTNHGNESDVKQPF
jgi:hypothetical protein